MRMFNLKENNIIDTKKGFGNIVDIFQNIMISQVLYCIMLTFDFNRYQNNDNNFQPFKYLSIIILIIMISIFEKYILEVWKLALAEILSSIILVAIIPIDGTKLILFAGCIFLCARSILKHRYIYSSAATYASRFRSKNKKWLWIFLMMLAFFYHFATSGDVETINTSKLCTYIMLTSFSIFVVSIILSEYAFKFYEYYRQKLKEDKSTEKQLKYSFMIIIIVSLVAMGVIFVFFGDLFVPVVEFITKIVLKIIFSIVLAIFNIDLSKKKEVGNEYSASEGGMDAIRNNNARADSPLSSIIPVIIIIIIVAAVLFFIWKLYKSILANYKIGTDEAQFIPLTEENNSYEEIDDKIIKQKYGKSNKEKIRKYYFQEISKRNKKNKKDNLSKKTPTEISNMFYENMKDSDKLKNMTEIYEKARYSNSDISEKEMQQMKNLYEKDNF